MTEQSLHRVWHRQMGHSGAIVAESPAGFGQAVLKAIGK
jgi:hypothetical protein